MYTLIIPIGEPLGRGRLAWVLEKDCAATPEDRLLRTGFVRGADRRGQRAEIERWLVGNHVAEKDVLWFVDRK